MQKNTPLETMYMEYAKTVKHFLISLCGNFDLAEDLTQKTFYQAYKSAHRYNGNYKISVWLCQIAKHLYFDYLKKEKHKTTVGIEHDEIVYVPFSKAIKNDKPIKRDLVTVLKELSI